MPGTKNVTLSLDSDTLASAQQCAAEEGVSLSAWMGRAARIEQMRVNGDRYQHLLDEMDPEERAALDALTDDSLRRAVTTAREQTV
jgi:hypothetical protein